MPSPSTADRPALAGRWMMHRDRGAELRALKARKVGAVRELREAAESLLAFIRERFPEDFKEGGRGFVCPHHARLERAAAEVKTIEDRIR